MKKGFLFLITVVLVFLLSSTAHALDTEAQQAAKRLHELGLFMGTGFDNNSEPVFDLDRTPTRAEAVTMLVRLLGKENEAKTGSWSIPFTDVVDWEKPYVGYAYAHGLTSGISDTTFGGKSNINATQFLTLILRALGYDSGADFRWDEAWRLSDQLGITDGEYDSNCFFSRGDVAIISYNALQAQLKGSNITLIRKLYQEGSVWSFDKIQNAGLGSISGLETISVPNGLDIDTQDGIHYLIWSETKEPVSNYDVYVSTTKNGDYSSFFSPSRNYVPLKTSVIYDLSEGETYYFKVRAHYWDEEKGEHYFSALSEPIIFKNERNAIERDGKAPLDIVLSIRDDMSDAAQNEQNALYMCQAAMTASSSDYGMYYAERAQEYFAKAEEDIYEAINLCGSYSNLSGLKVPLATIYGICDYAALYGITSSNYLSYVIEVSNHASQLTVYYEQGYYLLLDIVADY